MCLSTERVEAPCALATVEEPRLLNLTQVFTARDSTCTRKLFTWTRKQSCPSPNPNHRPANSYSKKVCRFARPMQKAIASKLSRLRRPPSSRQPSKRKCIRRKRALARLPTGPPPFQTGEVSLQWTPTRKRRAMPDK